MEKPYIPFYKPLGMSDETYRREVEQAKERRKQWERMQEEMKREQERRDEEGGSE